MPIVRIPSYEVTRDTEYDQSGYTVAMAATRAGQGKVLESGDVKLTVLGYPAAVLTADQGFLLVDLSDTTNFRHDQTGKILLYEITIDIDKDTNATGVLYIGVIVEVDATDGSVHWIDAVRLFADTDGADSTGYRHIVRKYYGLDLEVDTVNDRLKHVVTNLTQLNNATWQTDVNLDSPRGATTVAPGEGDLVAFLDWTAGNFYPSIRTLYRVEAIP